ncbi:MAG: dual specificity protein phosphatase family protein [Chloroflexi bacterium]|nr:dual specificity protein phosphatase family protein [Chloroflexota bacterium]
MSIKPKAPHPLERLRSHLTTGPRAIALRWVDVAHRRVLGSPVWELSEITPKLLLGGQHYYKKGYRRMLDYGITAIVNMRKEHSDEKKGIAGERHLQLATTDNTPPSVEDLMRGVDFIDDEINRGGKVYIHCAVGCGRAPTMTAAYLISTGDAPEQALRRIKQVRPFINLTKRQKRVLDEFAAAWSDRRSAT